MKAYLGCSTGHCRRGDGRLRCASRSRDRCARLRPGSRYGNGRCLGSRSRTGDWLLQFRIVLICCTRLFAAADNRGINRFHELGRGLKESESACKALRFRWVQCNER